MSGQPYVNGVSPCEGPPGTRVKISGEYLGVGAADVVSVKICGHECLETVEWLSSHRLVCQTREGFGKGSIIVSTLSGGVGTCTVVFNGTSPPPENVVRLNPIVESDVWADEVWDVFETSSGSMSQSDKRKTVADPMGLMDGRATRTLSQQNIRQLCPEGSGNLLAENFNPVMYLLGNHCGTSFQQLQYGRDNLQSEVERSQHAPGQFIKDNLDAFIQCYNTLSDVNELLIRNESESEAGSITDKVEGFLNDATSHADTLFQGVLHRKVKADAARNALTVLQRYRFLFNLPRSIEMNIRNGDYEIVTNDYERAKSLFAGTKVKVFSKVMEEVENYVSKLRTELKSQLLYNPTTLDQQRSLIKYMLDLEYIGDPAWECIDQLYKWTLDLLFGCKNKYQEPEIVKTEESRGHSRTLSNVDSGPHSVRKNTDAETRATDQGKPKRIQFVEELIEQIGKSLPNFWKLGQAYFNRTLITVMLSEQQDQIISENISRRKEEFDTKVLDIAEVYTDMVNTALFKDALDQIPEERVKRLGDCIPFTDDLAENSGAWLPFCVRQIRSCLNFLQGLNMPEKPLYLIQQLAINVRMLCAETLFYRTGKEIEELPLREDWRVQAEEGSVITSLPVLFENIVVEVLLTLKEIVIENHPGESMDGRKMLLESSVEYFGDLLEDFIHCLECLAFAKDESESKKETGEYEGEAISSSEEILNKLTPEEKMLLILSNSHYTKTQVCPRLFDCFVSHGYPECSSEETEFKNLLDGLDKNVFDEYIQLKVHHLLQLVEPGINAGYFDWQTKSPPKGVRDYVMNILLYLVHVHAEVYTVSADMTRRVLLELVQHVSSKLLEQLKQVKFSDEGALHAYVELRVLQETLYSNTNEASLENFKEAFNLLGIFRNLPEMNEIVEDFHQKTKLQFKCFYSEGSTPLPPAVGATPPTRPPKTRK